MEGLPSMVGDDRIGRAVVIVNVDPRDQTRGAPDVRGAERKGIAVLLEADEECLRRQKAVTGTNLVSVDVKDIAIITVVLK